MWIEVCTCDSNVFLMSSLPEDGILTVIKIQACHCERLLTCLIDWLITQSLSILSR